MGEKTHIAIRLGVALLLLGAVIFVPFLLLSNAVQSCHSSDFLPAGTISVRFKDGTRAERIKQIAQDIGAVDASETSATTYKFIFKGSISESAKVADVVRYSEVIDAASSNCRLTNTRN